MKPTIGRVVHAVRNRCCVAAIVNHVVDDAHVDATTFPGSVEVVDLAHVEPPAACPASSALGSMAPDDCPEGTWHWPAVPGRVGGGA